MFVLIILHKKLKKILMLIIIIKNLGHNQAKFKKTKFGRMSKFPRSIGDVIRPNSVFSEMIQFTFSEEQAVHTGIFYIYTIILYILVTNKTPAGL